MFTFLSHTEYLLLNPDYPSGLSLYTRKLKCGLTSANMRRLKANAPLLCTGIFVLIKILLGYFRIESVSQFNTDQLSIMMDTKFKYSNPYPNLTTSGTSGLNKTL